MLLGFKRRFAPFVEEGSKTHTLRVYGDRRPLVVGDRCDCYVDPRQKTMRLLGRFPCIKVEEVEIFGGGHCLNTNIKIDGAMLDGEERNAFAWRDGFRTLGADEAFREMLGFWRAEHGDKGGSIAFRGQVIHWDYARRELWTMAARRGTRRSRTHDNGTYRARVSEPSSTLPVTNPPLMEGQNR